MAGNWWEDASAYATPFWRDADAYAVHKPAEEPGFLEELTAKVRSGLQSGIDSTGRALGRLLPDMPGSQYALPSEIERDPVAASNAEDAQRLAQSERDFQNLDRTSASTAQGLHEISAADGPLDALGAAVRNPRAVAMTGAQSLGMMAPGMVAGAASGPAAPLTVGAGSAAIEYESTLRDTFSDAGVDLTDAAAVRAAMDDPELMAKAKDRAGKRGIAIGTFDALTAGVAGRLLGGARGVTSAAARTGGELGVQAGGGMAGEAVGQLATDQKVDKWGDVIMEGVAEVPSAITEVPTNYRRAREAFHENQDLESFVQGDYTELAQEHGATITSRKRSKKHNEEVGGVANSQHLTGTAGDFVVPEDRKAVFKAAARSRGYEVIDEGDHIHLELPPQGKRHTYADGDSVDNRRAQRQRDVAEWRKAPGTASVEDALDEARKKRGMPLDRAEQEPERSTDKPATAAPTQAPRDELLRVANDPLKSPAERRAAKRQAQQMPVVEQQPVRRISEQVEKLKDDLLDQITHRAPTPGPVTSTANQPVQQIEVQPPTQTIGGGEQFVAAQPARDRLMQVGYNPEIVDQMTDDEAMQSMREQPGWMPPRLAERTEPAYMPKRPLVTDRANTAWSETIRSIFNNDPNFLSSMRHGKPGLPAEPLRSEEVEQVALHPEQQAKLEQLGRVLGRKIVMYDLKTPYPGVGGFAADDRHIFLNPRSIAGHHISLANVVGHEFTHTLRRQGNAGLEDLIAYAKTTVNKQSSYIRESRKRYGALYAGRNIDFNDKVTEEHVADLIGDIVGDEKFWDEMAKENPSLFHRTINQFIRFLRNMADRARRLMDDDSAFSEIEEMRRRATAILKKHIQDEQANRWSPLPQNSEVMETPEAAADYNLTLEELRAFNGGADYSLTGTMVRTFTSRLGPVAAQLERWLLDEFRDVREIQKVIGNNTFGGRVPSNMDFHRNENLRHGAYKDARERAEERFVKPIARILSKAHLDLEGFSRYLWWRHAVERDAYLRHHLAPGMQVASDGLAGIDPLEAERNIGNLDPATLRAYERAAKFIDGMRKFTNDTLLASGQITQERYDAIMSQYEFYVPLRGLPPEMDGVMNAGYGQKSGLSMNRNPLGKRAAGRKSEPENIIEHMVRDMDNALVGQQKQRVLSSLVRLIAAHPDPDLWEVSPITYERKWVNGVLTLVQTNGESDNQVVFMHHGVPVKIEIRHAAMRKAMLNLNEPMPQWLRRIGKVTRWLSAVKTAFSPFFLLVNPVRDAGLATMSLYAEHGMDTVRSFGDYYWRTHYVLAKDQARKIAISSNPKIAKLQQYAREFAAIGGKTGYTYVNDIREQQKKLRNLMARHSESPGMMEIARNGVFSKEGRLLARKGAQHVAHLFETVNDMAENSTRLAVYAAMRDKGLSVEDAAAYAKEVTVNFNRRGSFGKVLGGFYMFFNAAMQGGARMTRLMGNKRFLAIMGSLFASSYALTLGQMLSAGDDDDGESKYMKAVSDSQAQRTLSVYLGNGKSLALPVPYGPNIFTYMGHRLARLTYDEMKGKRVSYGKVTGDIMAQAMTSMSPLDPGKGLSAFLPEIARIPIQTAMNRNDFGGPIAPKLNTRDRTGNPNFYDTDVKTGLGYRWMAQALNYATGGSGYDGGAVNWTGEQARYVTEQFTGGLGRLASQSYELIDNWTAGIDPEPSDVPLSNVYFRGKGSEMHAGSYYDNLDNYQNTVKDWKLAVANNDESKIKSLLKDAPWVEGAELDASTREGRDAQAGSMMDAARDIERKMKGLRKAKDAIIAGNVKNDDGSSMSRAQRKQEAYAIDQQIAELQQDFNYEFNAARGNPVRH